MTSCQGHADLKGIIERLVYRQQSEWLRSLYGPSMTIDMMRGLIDYRDLSPDEAYRFYSREKGQCFILDVAEGKNHLPFPHILHIPYSQLKQRLQEIPQQHFPILVMDEEGVNSVLACELLVSEGFLNVNNVSGGYTYWPEFR